MAPSSRPPRRDRARRKEQEPGEQGKGNVGHAADRTRLTDEELELLAEWADTWLTAEAECWERAKCGLSAPEARVAGLVRRLLFQVRP